MMKCMAAGSVHPSMEESTFISVDDNRFSCYLRDTRQQGVKNNSNSKKKDGENAVQSTRPIDCFPHLLL